MYGNEPNQYIREHWTRKNDHLVKALAKLQEEQFASLQRPFLAVDFNLRCLELVFECLVSGKIEATARASDRAQVSFAQHRLLEDLAKTIVVQYIENVGRLVDWRLSVRFQIHISYPFDRHFSRATLKFVQSFEFFRSIGARQPEELELIWVAYVLIPGL